MVCLSLFHCKFYLYNNSFNLLQTCINVRILYDIYIFVICRSSYPDYEEHRAKTDDPMGDEAAGGGDSDEEEEVQSDVLDEDNFQLVLPSGRYI